MASTGKKSYNLEENVRTRLFVHIFAFCAIFNRKFRVYLSSIDIFKIKTLSFNSKGYLRMNLKFSVFYKKKCIWICVMLLLFSDGGKLNESHIIDGLLPSYNCPSDTRVTTRYHCFEGGRCLTLIK